MADAREEGSSLADERVLTSDDIRRGENALRLMFSLRLVMLAGSLGSFLGSLLMFYQGFLHVWEAFREIGHSTEDHVAQITVPILEAVDSFLFGVVLVIFAYGIAVGFIFRLPPRLVRILPSWMKITGVGQLKAILAEVVIVVLIVIFARVVVEAGTEFTWNLLVLPVSIVLLAGAVWLLALGGHDGTEEQSENNHSDRH